MSGPTPQSAGKVARSCPHCGFKQLESPFAKSTFCRRCGEYYEPGKPKPIVHNERPSFFERVGRMLSSNKTRDITCFDCGAVQKISSSSTSSLCPACGAYIDLTDFKINTTFSRMVQTQGEVKISGKADVTSAKVACREAYLEGKLRGNLLCTGTAHVKYKGKISGSIEAKHIAIHKRSEIEFVRPLKAKSVEICGKIVANLQVDGTVKIAKRGWLQGSVYAKGIIVEKGGVFLGELVIGSPDSESDMQSAKKTSSVQVKTDDRAKKTGKESEDKTQPDLGLGV